MKALACVMAIVIATAPVFAYAGQFRRANCNHVGHCNCIPYGYVETVYLVPIGVPSYVQFQVLASPAFHAPQSAAPSTYSAPKAQPAATNSLVNQHCATCHNGAKQKPNLTNLAALAPQVKLNCVKRVMSQDPSKHMPKDHELNPDEAAGVIAELSN